MLKDYCGKKLAVGVSGGRDSVCLLHAAVNCGAVDRSQVIAVHVNHGIRNTAERDEQFTRELCASLGVEFRAVKVDAPKYAAANRMPLEQAARELRYGVFYDLIKSGAADAVLTAHHALDNAESVLMHIFRGAGLDGLAPMYSPQIVRPFLDVYPDELDGYVKDNGLRYVVDETNLDAAADRNFLRLKVMPLIQERYGGAVRAINRLADEAAQVRAFIDGELDPRLITVDGDAVIVHDAALKSALAARYMRKALEHFTLTDMTRAQIMSAVALKDARTGAAAALSHGVVAMRETGGVALFIPREKCGDEVAVKAGANTLDGIVVDIKTESASPRDVKGGAVDMNAIDGAVLRFRRDGDRFTPYGGGEKKLKQYFIDKKISKRLRDRIPLICRGCDVLVIVGVEISDKVKQTEKTTKENRVVIRKRW